MDIEETQTAPQLPSAIPRINDPNFFLQNPLPVLLHEFRQGQQLMVVRESGPLLSRARDCVGCIAALGVNHTRQVLSGLDSFGMPVSVARRFSLPTPLLKLNSGLFSMVGEQHRLHQRILLPMLDIRNTDYLTRAVQQGCAAFLEGWEDGLRFPLMDEMRRLALHISSRVFFGCSPRALEVGTSIQDYFLLRREFAGSGPEAARRIRPHLVKRGMALDRTLRTRIHSFPHEDPHTRNCFLEQLSLLKNEAGPVLSEDELVAHGNVLFMSATEPIATALTWTLLLLTQFPELVQQLRNQLREASVAEGLLNAPGSELIPLLEYVVKESIRLFPPNAIMTRLTTCATELGGFDLPVGCEILLSPFVSHRDPQLYPDPDLFQPERWRVTGTSPFGYYPFGAGGRYCLGKNMAMQMLMSALAALIESFDLLLGVDQEINWKMNVTLMPANDPLIQLRSSRHRTGEPGARLRGTVCDLVTLP